MHAVSQRGAAWFPAHHMMFHTCEQTLTVGGSADPSPAGGSAQSVLENVPLVIEEPQVTQWATEVALVHDADERGVTGRGHPADALDMVDDPLADTFVRSGNSP